jgi:hypothetical protein
VSTVEGRVEDALSLDDGVVTLGPVDPFPAGTEYPVPLGTTITYSGANAVMVAAVTAPGRATPG